MAEVAGFNHFGVTVSDMASALAFWRDLLGLELLGHGVVEYDHLDQIVGLAGTRIEWAELALPSGGRIELFRYLSPDGRQLDGKVNDAGKTHLCLQVRDVDGLLERLQRAGVRSAYPQPVEIPTGDWRGFRCVYVFAPDEVVVELVERPVD
ncbi:MAG TPA: VOC family protein [Streptosporangiaceae bacterium]|nr:VOC family protein [Streptosporangiaceae bacterium]